MTAGDATNLPLGDATAELLESRSPSSQSPQQQQQHHQHQQQQQQHEHQQQHEQQHEQRLPSSLALQIQTPRNESSACRKYELQVDEDQFDRATHYKLHSLARPHMRTFHLAWLSCMMAFLGWYAIPPLMPVIKTQLGLTNAQVLNSDIASTASTILMRISVGPLCDLFGPRVVQSGLLWFGAIPIVAAAFVTSANGLIVVRACIGLIGSIFVSSQYWTTITFAKNVVGTCNAISGGLALSGIGLAFLLLPCIEKLLAMNMREDLAWRLTIALPAVAIVTMGFMTWWFADCCPLGHFSNLKMALNEAHASSSPIQDHDAASSPSASGYAATSENASASSSSSSSSWCSRLFQCGSKQTNESQSLETSNFGRRFVSSYQAVLADTNVIILTLHYAVSFGTELQVNNMAALYFYEEFKTSSNCSQADGCHQLTKTSAALLGSSFGLLNLFTRAIGGIASDQMNQRFGMKGRLRLQLVLLLCQGTALMVLSSLRSLSSCIALFLLVACFAQSSGGSIFSIVPYLNKPRFSGTVTGLVGAGGNIGGVIFGVLFKQVSSRHQGLLLMGIITSVSSLLTFCVKS